MLEFASLPTHLLWSLLPAVLSTCIHVLYAGSIKRIFFARSLRTDSKAERKVCRILALCCMLLYSLGTVYLNRTPSAFATLSISGCSDPRIKEKYRTFIRANHPDKSKVTSEAFGQQKAMYEILRDKERCERYDVFGLSQDNYDIIAKTEKECVDHFLVHSLLFYGSCFFFFFVLPICSRPVDELIEPLLIYTLSLALEMDSIVFSRHGMLGRLAARFKGCLGGLALHELRYLIRSSLVPCLLFCNQVRQVISHAKLSDIERSRRLEKVNRRLRRLVQGR